MRKFLVVVLGVLVTFGVCQAAGENPLANAKVGDWVEMKAINDINGQKTEQTKRLEVTKKDDQNITIKTAVTVEGKTQPSTEAARPLNEGFEPLNDGTDRKVIEEGNEAILVGSRSIPCHKIKYQVTVALQGRSVTVYYTDWTSSEIPLCPKIKTVIEQHVGKTTVVFSEWLVSYGRAY